MQSPQLPQLEALPSLPKIESVLPATRSALRRAIATGQNRGWARPLAEIQADLCRPLPDDYISWFNKKGVWIPYLTWTDANLILDYVAPGWQCDISENQVGDRVVVKCSLTLLCAEGQISRCSLGSDGLDDDAYGGPLPDSESQAFRRAAVRFGLGIYLYDRSIIDALKRRFKK